ncbi:MAG: hypothetical protein ACW980_25695 [Promethearchaeota archaeon]|jgi:hypothetical protein
MYTFWAKNLATGKIVNFKSDTPDYKIGEEFTVIDSLFIFQVIAIFVNHY